MTAAAALLVAAGPAAARSAFVSRRIVVEQRGRGPDLILIPGLASTAEVWRGLIRNLEGRRRLHLVSLRGFGDLPAEGNAEGAIMSAAATEVRRYITQERLIRPAIVGHSMGGQIAMKVAADAPSRVDRLMTVDASPFFPALIRPGATVGDVEPIAQVAYQALQFLGDDVLRNQGRGLGLDLGGAADALFGAMGWQGGDRRVLAQAVYEVMTIDLRNRLSDITAPVTVVYGWNADQASPRSRADHLFKAAYASATTTTTFERIEGAEHMVMIDQPRRFFAAIERFLA